MQNKAKSSQGEPESSSPAVDRVTALKQTALFESLDETALQLLAAEFEPVHLAQRQYLFRQGDSSDDGLYILVAGRLAVAISQPGADDLIVDELGAGDLVGEVGFLNRLPRTASIRALEDCDLLRFSQLTYNRLASDSPEVGRQVGDLIQQRLRASRLADMLPNLFGPLDKEALIGIEKELKWLHLAGGDQLLRQGDPSDSLYFIVSGRLLAVVADSNGDSRVVEELLPGETIGEMGLFGNAPRSTDVYAARDSMLVEFTRESLDRLTDAHPQVLRQITAIVIGRLQQKVRAAATTTASHNIALVVVGPDLPLKEFAADLARSLTSYGPTTLLDSELVDSTLNAPGMAQTEAYDPDGIRLDAWLDMQGIGHSFILLVVDSTVTAWTRRCLRNADRILVLAWADSEPGESDIVALLKAQSDGPLVVQAQRELVLLHRQPAPLPSGTRKWLQWFPAVGQHYHIRWPDAAAARRVARSLAGRAVGLVLSGGGARGFAHVGVIRALEELGIEVDIVGGTSFGALVGGLFAMGWDAEQMYEKARELARSKDFFDYTIPAVAIMAGRRVNALLERLFGETFIEDSWRDFFCISANLTRARMEVHQRGLLRKYVRASMSLPVILPPVVDGEDLLIDGVVLNNLPLDVMRQRVGNGTVLGVDVGVEEDLTGYENLALDISGWKVLRSRLNPFSEPVKAPSVFAILMRVLELPTVSRKKSHQALADLTIRPPVGPYSILDFDSFEEILQAGYQTGRQALEEWLSNRPEMVVQDAGRAA